MNVLLLGNGFDLHHKLPTNYNDFLQTVSYLIDHFNPDMKTIGDVFENAELQSNSKNIKNCYEKQVLNKLQNMTDEQFAELVLEPAEEM